MQKYGYNRNHIKYTTQGSKKPGNISNARQTKKLVPNNTQPKSNRLLLPHLTQASRKISAICLYVTFLEPKQSCVHKSGRMRGIKKLKTMWFCRDKHTGHGRMQLSRNTHKFCTTSDSTLRANISRDRLSTTKASWEPPQCCVHNECNLFNTVHND